MRAWLRRALAWLNEPLGAPPPPAPAPAADIGIPISAFDAKRLVADLRRGDPAALERAYRQVFDNELGRQVLMHHLIECGVGGRFGLELDDAQLRYAVGRHDAAVDLASRIFDAAAIVVAGASDQLQGSLNDETAHHPQGHAAGRLGYDWDLDDHGG